MNRFASRFATILGVAALLLSTTATAQTSDELPFVAEAYPIVYEASAAPTATTATVTTRWQGTINLISHADERTAARYEAHNARAVTLLDALKRGRRPVVRDLLLDAVKETGTADINNLVDLFKQAHGPITNYTIQGTVPRSDRTAYTFADVHFADGTRKVLRMTWTNKQLVTVIHTQPLMIEPAAGPQDAAWQPTINWLSGADETTAAAYQARNVHATRILEGLRRNDTGPLYEALREDRKVHGTADIAHMLSIYTDEHGPIQGYAVQGTLPRGERTAYTFVEIEFADGERTTYRLYWLTDQLVGFANTRPLLTLANQTLAKQ